jgi:hypothetical protein
VPPKKTVPTYYFPYIYALLSRKNCIDLCQIPHDREQHRSVMQTLAPGSQLFSTFPGCMSFHTAWVISGQTNAGHNRPLSALSKSGQRLATGLDG